MPFLVRRMLHLEGPNTQYNAPFLVPEATTFRWQYPCLLEGSSRATNAKGGQGLTRFGTPKRQLHTTMRQLHTTMGSIEPPHPKVCGGFIDPPLR